MKKNTLGSLIWLRISRFAHQSNLLSNDFLKQYDITVAQFDLLNQIATYEPITQKELAQKVTVTEGGISRMVARLEKDGLLKRKQDWKTKTIFLTEKGREKLDDVFQAQLQFQTSLFDEVLTEDEQKTLLQLMTKLQKNSEERLLTKN
ncbi:MAG TPA: MarR family transcriptional regulator [Pseudogracilibacillus sp.]|nr:MarR family transcriptional regulator [Pseudogracilibacillus sp.]